jgi:GNAT superfamily N-acetyltransferase
MSARQIEISQARADADIADVRQLFREYSASIGVDLEYQGFSSELVALPGQYAPPSGDLLVAKVDGEAAGCVALRALDQSTLEMKRLYVRPAARGAGLGKLLIETAISIASQNGYSEMKLDTLASMATAQKLYGALGFVEIPPYGNAYLPGTRFYSLALAK